MMCSWLYVYYLRSYLAYLMRELNYLGGPLKKGHPVFEIILVN